MVSFPFFKKKEEAPFYFGVTITDVSTSGFIFDLQDGKPQIRTQSSYDVPPVYDQVLQALDTVISDIESTEKITIQNTIFFLLSSQLDAQSHEIKEPYKSILKKASSELALVPMGYIDMHEAIATSLKDKSIVNFMLVEIDQHTVSVYVYKGAACSFSGTQSRTSSLPDDLEAIIAARPAGSLIPTKLYLYGSADMTHASSEISTHQWSESVFVQHPLIEVVKDGTIMQIMADTCAAELVSQQSEPKSPVVSQEPALQHDSADKMGFLIGVDVASHTPAPQPIEREDVVKNVPASPMPSPFAQSSVPPPQINRPKPVSTYFQSIMSKISLPHVSIGGGVGILLPLVILIALACGGGAFEYYAHKAEIEVQVDSKTQDTSLELQIPVSEDAQVGTLAALLHTKTAAITQSIDTSGKRDIGEKAKGQVVIHNFDNAEKNFEKGTKITAGSYTFLLDTSVSVASSSGVISDGVKQSGKAKVSVTAENIGPDYNLKNSTQFSINSLQTALYVAFADGALTGGTKKQITTVSKSDLDGLKKKAQDAAVAETSKNMSAGVPSDEVVITGLSDVELKDVDYSKEVGEEASQVTLKGSADLTFYTVKKTALERTLSDALKERVPSTFTIDKNRIKYSFVKPSIDSKKSEITTTVKAVSVALKSVDRSVLQHKSAMKLSHQLVPALKSVEGVLDAVIISQKPQFSFMSWTPLFARNITIRVDSR